LVGLDAFGDNPGRLRMLAHVPPALAGQPLVVLLHGCGQNAARFAADSGWIAMADQRRFPLILPDQADRNHASRCFQWFHAQDTARDQGEAASIAAMTRAAISRYDCDPRRVFIVGLSAGAAMAAAMLAAYPDLFAAGAAVAGLPVGAAKSGIQAIMRMASAGPEQAPLAWADQVRRIGPAGFDGPWPKLSVWHGSADTTVAQENGERLTEQWRALHGLADAPVRDVSSGGVRHRIWAPAVESWTLEGFPHAYPVGDRSVEPGHFVAPAKVDATAEIARFFGLA